MDKEDSENFNFQTFEEDEQLQWWQPSKQDDYNLTNKLFRAGCRPAKRKYITCQRDADIRGEECKALKQDLEKCIKI